MIALLLSLLFGAPVVDPLDVQVRLALTQRDSFCVTLREGAPPLIFSKADPIARGRLGVMLSNAETSRNAWFHLLRALYEKSNGTEKGEMFLENALFVADRDVGTLVAIALELGRQGEYPWALQAAKHANASFLRMGGQASPLMVGLWERLGREDSMDGAQWRVLSRELSGMDWLQPESAELSLPALLDGAFIQGRWRSYLALVRHAWGWLRTAGWAFLLLVLLAFSVRHLPLSLHWLQESMGWVPARMRPALSWAGVCGTVALGWHMLAWTVLLMVAPRLRTQAERAAGLLAGCLLLLLPLDAWLEHGLADLDAGQGRLGTLVSALDGLPGSDSGLAGAVSQLKAGQGGAAVGLVKGTLAQDSSSSYAWSCLGTALAQGGDAQGARDAWQHAWNLGRRGDADRAAGARRDSSGKAFEVPAPSPGDIAGLFFRSQDWEGTRRSWSTRSLVPLDAMAALGALLMAALVFLMVQRMGFGLRIEACSLCGAAHCLRCRSFGACRRCGQKLSEADPGLPRRTLRLGLLASRVRRRRLLGLWLDAALPGTGSLTAGTGFSWAALGVFLGTCGAVGLLGHSLTWISELEGVPGMATRLWGMVPLALWVGAVVPLGRKLANRQES